MVSHLIKMIFVPTQSIAVCELHV